LPAMMANNLRVGDIEAEYWLANKMKVRKGRTSASAASVAETNPTKTAKCFSLGASRVRLDACALTPLSPLIPTA
jgi:hypothetical protein